MKILLTIMLSFLGLAHHAEAGANVRQAGSNFAHEAIKDYDTYVNNELAAGRRAPAPAHLAPGDLKLSDIAISDFEAIGHAKGVFFNHGIFDGNTTVHAALNLGGFWVTLNPAQRATQPVEVFNSVQLDVLNQVLSLPRADPTRVAIDGLIDLGFLRGVVDVLSTADAHGNLPMGPLNQLSVQFFVFPTNGIGGNGAGIAAIAGNRVGITIVQGASATTTIAAFHGDVAAKVAGIANVTRIVPANANAAPVIPRIPDAMAAIHAAAGLPAPAGIVHADVANAQIARLAAEGHRNTARNAERRAIAALDLLAARAEEVIATQAEVNAATEANNADGFARNVELAAGLGHADDIAAKNEANLARNAANDAHIAAMGTTARVGQLAVVPAGQVVTDEHHAILAQGVQTGRLTATQARVAMGW